MFFKQLINNKQTFPCKLDHNGECLLCDCWLQNCAYERFLNKDYTYESEEDFKRMFGPILYQYQKR